MTMADESKGMVAAGASLVWRRQRVFWWVFAVNFILAALGTAPAHHQLEEVLGHSLAGRPLTNGFDLRDVHRTVPRPRIEPVSLAQ